MTLVPEIHRLFGDRVRLRVCGICRRGDDVLLIRHEGIGTKGYLWAPPGGGVHFGEALDQTLIREFQEETHLEITVGPFLFLNEFIRPPLHAIELFFAADERGGTLQRGHDPEMAPHTQLIGEVAFVPFAHIKQDDPALYHNAFGEIEHLDDLYRLGGRAFSSR
ncbi:ADP-ribose pyrophosphatase YjhB, NUDIX family [Catalinimonas alkaloidigena]|uniref:ADP-ribose pyrophosphatase YjhB, NUDIX family n=1 Tax=Catalinimonas alkaloidigena TaxID=1075417 RepID=A0A1G9K3I9_9BACT|nr:NUDIX hydrolase [Catalinimonas alkaloidigena]SDL43984.1 ADP-ribose pyrophosphatase YjhB, NUDIX family [Catalinimonas alkaloidigena]